MVDEKASAKMGRSCFPRMNGACPVAPRSRPKQPRKPLMSRANPRSSHCSLHFPRRTRRSARPYHAHTPSMRVSSSYTLCTSATP
ncbi:hypothetical protein IQ06DRAFT_59951 [Phaeosphaeriaceae sp. SRC1lsM3a]|nr:hypothetical protein IQ06DRAFT_59951 [Stagonospora sp. SRC1lsM3a]